MNISHISDFEKCINNAAAIALSNNIITTTDNTIAEHPGEQQQQFNDEIPATINPTSNIGIQRTSTTYRPVTITKSTTDMETMMEKQEEDEQIFVDGLTATTPRNR